VAVIVADPFAVIVPAVAVNCALDCPAATVTEPGTATLPLLLARATEALLLTAAVIETEHVAAVPEVSVVGLQDTADSVGVPPPVVT
jgi:hypothetical protein